jgi:hypothetical protein
MTARHGKARHGTSSHCRWRSRSTDTTGSLEYTKYAVASSRQRVVIQLGGLREGLTTSRRKNKCYEMARRISDLVYTCKHNNEPSGSTTCREFIDQTRNCEVLKEGVCSLQSVSQSVSHHKQEKFSILELNSYQVFFSLLSVTNSLHFLRSLNLNIYLLPYIPLSRKKNLDIHFRRFTYNLNANVHYWWFDSCIFTPQKRDQFNIINEHIYTQPQ